MSGYFIGTMVWAAGVSLIAAGFTWNTWRRGKLWTVASRFENKISEVDLNFETPNIWGGQSETEQALRRLKETNNADSVEVQLKNSENKLHIDSKDVRDSVEYITQGGGSVRLRGPKGRIVFDSEKNVVTDMPPEDGPLQESDMHLIMRLINRLLRR